MFLSLAFLKLLSMSESQMDASCPVLGFNFLHILEVFAVPFSIRV